jgi:hypothetical protein
MNQPYLLLAPLYGFALAGIALILIVCFCAKRERAGAQPLALQQQKMENSLETLRQKVETLASQAGDCQEQRSPGPVPTLPMAGLNMTKRSQALRMHRKGDTTERIADILNIPLQEVDLLLKVNRIIVRNF